MPGIAAVLVGSVTIARKEKISLTDGTWRPGLTVGILFALGYLFVAEALRYATAAHAAVFLYTAPIFAALGLHWRLPSEHLKPIQWAGIALALAGIGVAFLGNDISGPASSQGEMLRGDLLALMGGASYGATMVVIRCTALSRAPASQTLPCQLIGAFVLLLGVASVNGQLSFEASPVALGALAFQTLMVSFASFLVWFWLLKERIEPSFVTGSLLVLAGIVLVSGYEWIKSQSDALRKPRNAT